MTNLLEELKRALEPFSTIAGEAFARNYSDDDTVAIKFRDLRRARSALAALEAAGSDTRVTDKLITDLEAIPLADMTEQDQRTFAAAIGQLRRLSDRVHMLEIRQHRRDAAGREEKVEKLEAALTEATAELIYLRKYGSLGAVWSANESKDVWREQARAAIAAVGGK